MNVGVVGLGKMGIAIAKRLVERGFVVTGWDVDASRAEDVERLGAAFANLAALVSQSEIILSIVTDDAAVRWLFESRHGLLASDVRGKLFVEMSTLQPATVRIVGAAAERAGAHLIGAPVLGSIPTVNDGKLLVLAGGRPDDVERSKAVLSALARNVLCLGPLGAGNAMKLVVNLTMAAYVEALAEGLALGEKQGLRIDQMLSVLVEAPTANPWLHAKLAVLNGESAPLTLDIAALRKDVLSAVATGAVDGLSMPLASGVLSALSAAAAAGYGPEDLARLPEFFRQHMVRRPTQDPLESENG